MNIVAICSAAASILSAQAGAPADVPRNHWAFEAVDTLFKAGILHGYPDGTFKGNRMVSRYELAGTLATVNGQFDARIKALQGQLDALKAQKVSTDAEAAQLLEKAKALKADIEEIRLQREAVVGLTGTMASLREQLQKIRESLAETHEKVKSVDTKG